MVLKHIILIDIKINLANILWLRLQFFLIRLTILFIYYKFYFIMLHIGNFKYQYMH